MICTLGATGLLTKVCIENVVHDSIYRYIQTKLLFRKSKKKKEKKNIAVCAQFVTICSSVSNILCIGQVSAFPLFNEGMMVIE